MAEQCPANYLATIPGRMIYATVHCYLPLNHEGDHHARVPDVVWPQEAPAR